MNILFAGDTHGNFKHFRNTILKTAQKNDCPIIIQTGDFGYVWLNRKGKPNKQIHIMGQMLAKQNKKMFFVAGNHEDYTLLEELGAYEDGHQITEIAQNIYHIPRGHVIEIDDVRIMGMGGAVSVDRGMGDANWWPQESITYAQVDKACTENPVDVIVSHDTIVEDGSKLDWALNNVQWMNTKTHNACRSNRTALLAVVQSAQPNVLIHGHYHYRYEDTVGNTKIIGLDRDTTGQKSLFLFDTNQYKTQHKGNLSWDKMYSTPT